jgi:hypothetical protein
MYVCGMWYVVFRLKYAGMLVCWYAGMLGMLVCGIRRLSCRNSTYRFTTVRTVEQYVRRNST